MPGVVWAVLKRKVDVLVVVLRLLPRILAEPAAGRNEEVDEDTLKVAKKSHLHWLQVC